MTKNPLVILVEDEHSIAKLIEFKLKRGNYDFIHCDNGKKGWQSILENKPDLAILDVMLPSMNGFEILSNIRSHDETKHIKVIMLTAKAKVKDMETGFKLRADDYMEKPFKPDELMMRMERVLHR
jgi:two-component system alkaline phosphatase synthesis response regulator PhoP